MFYLPSDSVIHLLNNLGQLAKFFLCQEWLLNILQQVYNLQLIQKILWLF